MGSYDIISFQGAALVDKPTVAQKPWFSDIHGAWEAVKKECGWDASN